MHANIRFILMCIIWIVLLLPADGMFSFNNRRSKYRSSSKRKLCDTLNKLNPSPAKPRNATLELALCIGLPATFVLFFIVLFSVLICCKRAQTQTGAQRTIFQNNKQQKSAQERNHIKVSTNGPQQTPYDFQQNQPSVKHNQSYRPQHGTHGLKYSGSPPAYWDIFRPDTHGHTPSRGQMRFSPYSINNM